MPFDKITDIETINEDRHKAILKSIRVMTLEELRKLGDQMFSVPDHPWREAAVQLMAENPAATFYHASAGEGVIFLYCRDVDKGLWYLPGSGMGPLSETGRQAMKDAIAQMH